MSEPRQDGALQDFWQWETTARVEVVADLATDKRDYFMPSDVLRTCLEANGGQRLFQLFSTLFKVDEFPFHPELILRGHTAVFCILLHIGKGNYIEQFACYEELSDRRLPFDPNHPPPYFPATDDPTFLQKFCEKQWMYCVPVLDTHMLHKHFGPQRLLPITRKEALGDNGSSSIYKIELYAPYNKVLPTVSNMQTNNFEPNTFIIERYSKENKTQYMQKINDYRNLKHPDSISRFCGSFIHGDESNILLECADKGSLEEYFQKQSPPSRGVDIIKFWEAMFKLLDALKAIHSVLGSHQNIKPSKVLVMSYGAESPSDWKFKMADFGQSQVKSKIPGEEVTKMENDKTNAMYSAPECYIPFNLHDTQASDVWSLGCIYSEAAIWISDGYKGVTDYRRKRGIETSSIVNFQGGSCFHDGVRVLKAVRDAHIEIEESLRRSDYITKDVLDSMVDEMLWEEDRPKVNALLRKAEGVLSRARQRLPSSESSRSPIISSQFVLPPRPQPPTRPLPEIPRRAVASGSPLIGDQQYLPNVERWRSQVPIPPITDPRFNTPTIEVASPIYGREERYKPESISDLDREINGSISSWQMNDNSSQASPITPFTSPFPSAVNDHHRQMSGELRPRSVPYRTLSQRSPVRKVPKAMSHDLSYTTSENRFVGPSIAETPPESSKEITSMSLPTSPLTGRSAAGDSMTLIDENRTIDQNSRHPSSAFSIPLLDPTIRNEELSSPISANEIPIPPRSQKRSELSLFPQPPTSPKAGSLPIPSPVIHLAPSIASIGNDKSATGSRPDTPLTASSIPLLPAQPLPDLRSIDYLSLDTTLEWKRAHKKVKKWERAPPLPGARWVEELKERDHIFIVDDAASMKDCWADVKRLFEALSYVVKGMSPEGTDLFYTVSYDTWRRKDTSDLCDYLEKKSVGGKTDIKYRLNLQLQSFQTKIAATKPGKNKKNKLRPQSYYILTNGDWAAGADPKPVISSMADFLATTEVEVGKNPVTIQFISFAQTPTALQRMNNLAREDFGQGNIVDCTQCSGNILKMLRGPLDRITKPKQVDNEKSIELGTTQLATRTPVAGIWGGEMA